MNRRNFTGKSIKQKTSIFFALLRLTYRNFGGCDLAFIIVRHCFGNFIFELFSGAVFNDP